MKRLDCASHRAFVRKVSVRRGVPFPPGVIPAADELRLIDKVYGYQSQGFTPIAQIQKIDIGCKILVTGAQIDLHSLQSFMTKECPHGSTRLAMIDLRR